MKRFAFKVLSATASAAPRRFCCNGSVGAKYPKRRRAVLAAALQAILLSLHPAPLMACAACYGQSDSPMARGMNWGIFSLLVVVVGVLGGIASAFIFLARRAATASPQTPVNSCSPITVTDL